MEVIFHLSDLTSAPLIVLPGNHDRRKFGFLGPQRSQPFRDLARALQGPRTFVAGTRTPFLAQIVPDGLHGLPMHVVVYDSSYLPDGLVGAGGTLRLEDLLQVHAQLPDDDRPLLVLMHHHLIPTPVTDVSGMDHTHAPTARLLKGMTSGCGDVLLASAGTAARRERVQATRDPDAARLWPCFNVLAVAADTVRIEAVSFFPKRSSRPAIRRLLAHTRRDGPKWELASGTFRVSDPAPRVERDEARFTLAPSRQEWGRWDVSCERSVELIPGVRLPRYIEFVRSAPPKLGPQRRRVRARRIELQPGGTTRYEAPDALCRTLREASRSYGSEAAFEWLGLLCRYGAQRAALSLSNSNLAGVRPFASFTDLTTGRERPLPIVPGPDGWTAVAEKCAPRSLLRIYWPLEG
jgi:hypothetical protein